MLSKQLNKGFTLVELLVSLCILAIVMTELMALMFNSSKLYRNASFEVDLQSEAQQIIQQIEELTIDADTSVSYNAGVITVTNSTPYASYEFSLSPVAGKPYNDLMLKTNGGAAQLMGEYVKSVSLDMANYDDASRVRLIIEMQNDKYEYAAAKDLYLRNDIGANDSHTTAVVSEACDYDLNVLRFAKYDLKALYGNDYVYVFVVDPHMEYELTGPTKTAVESATSKINSPQILNTSVSFNGAGGDSLEPEYVVQAYEFVSNKYVPAFTIKVHSEKVCFGNNGYGVACIPNTSIDMDNYYSVQGVSVSAGNVSSMDYYICCVADPNSTAISIPNLTYKANNTGSDDYSSAPSVTFSSTTSYSRTLVMRSLFKSYTGDPLKGVMDASTTSFGFQVSTSGSVLLTSKNLKLFGTKFKLDDVNNDLDCIQNIQYQSGDYLIWQEFIYKYGVFYIEVVFNYNGDKAPSGGRQFSMKIYPIPIGTYAYPSTPQNVMGRFFDIAK